MKIAVIGHIRHAIAAPFQGGMEAHCHQLVQALENKGHEVTLFAANGSDARRMVAVCDAPYEACLPWATWRGTERLQRFQSRAFARARRAIAGGAFDVVHNNSLSTDVIDWAREDGTPMVTSQHVPPFPAMRAAVSRASGSRCQIFTVTSADQLSLWSEGSRDGCRAGSAMRVVPNGIDLDRWPPARERGQRLIWFGRIAATKGLREAVAATRLAGACLDIVGMMEDEAYFDCHVRPHLSDRIRYLGHLSGDALHDVVSQASAALVTPMWDEPFGLVAAEAMATGVPVIAFDRGAMREVLGECGRIVPAGDIEALADAVRDADALDGQACRDRIRALFSVERMIAGYEAAYRQAMAGSRAEAEAAATASSCSRTEALLA